MTIPKPPKTIVNEALHRLMKDAEQRIASNPHNLEYVQKQKRFIAQVKEALTK